MTLILGKKPLKLANHPQVLLQTPWHEGRNLASSKGNAKEHVHRETERRLGHLFMAIAILVAGAFAKILLVSPKQRQVPGPTTFKLFLKDCHDPNHSLPRVRSHFGSSLPVPVQAAPLGRALWMQPQEIVQGGLRICSYGLLQPSRKTGGWIGLAGWWFPIFLQPGLSIPNPNDRSIAIQALKPCRCFPTPVRRGLQRKTKANIP